MFGAVTKTSPAWSKCVNLFVGR